jgi:hypothetical protein
MELLHPFISPPPLAGEDTGGGSYRDDLSADEIMI